MSKRRLKFKYKNIIIILCIFCMMYSLLNIINLKKDVDKNKNIKKQIEENIVLNEEDNTYKIDFKSLKEQNSDTIAYLKVNGTNINYVVVKGNDNSYYLNHNFEKQGNVAGWIFADYRNTFNGTDKNLIIYGHNTHDGSMFGTLKNILNKQWYEDKRNHKIALVTEKNTYYYQVFSTYSIDTENYYINTKFSSNDEFNKFVNKLKSRSFYNYNVQVSENDKVLTLSSCMKDGRKRVVLHAKLIQNEG